MNLDPNTITTTSQNNATGPEAIMQLDYNRGALASFIARIPKNYIVGLGKILGYFLYFFDLSHRRIVRSNLQFIYPG